MNQKDITEHFKYQALAEKGLYEILSGPALICTLDIESGPKIGDIVHATNIYDFSGKYSDSIKLNGWPGWYSLEYFAFAPEFFS